MLAEAWERRREPREVRESGPDGTGKWISVEQSGEVPGTRKQPESVKRVKNIQNLQFHRVGRHMAYQRASMGAGLTRVCIRAIDGVGGCHWMYVTRDSQ